MSRPGGLAFLQIATGLVGGKRRIHGKGGPGKAGPGTPACSPVLFLGSKAPGLEEGTYGADPDFGVDTAQEAGQGSLGSEE